VVYSSYTLTISYMTENTNMVNSEVVLPVERYLADRRQALAYKVGMLKILALREKAERVLDEKFDLRDIPDAVLGHGPRRLLILEEIVDEYISMPKNGGKQA